MTRQVEDGLWWRPRPGKRRAVPLRAVQATAVVQTGLAVVVLRQRFGHDEARPIEAIYTMPLPSRAALTRLTLEVGGRRIEGEVTPRDEAFRAYDQAVGEGHGAALVEQERDEVVTVTVGNVLPGEEVVVELEYIEPLQVDEGVLRWRLPTRVAPRHVPGQRTGHERTGHGTVEPTDQVPDADRVTPPAVTDAGHRLALSLQVDLGVPVRVESPSHRWQLERLGGEAVQATFVAHELALDRDVVVQIELDGPPVEAAPVLVAHRDGEGAGTFALTLVPDLAVRATSSVRRVVLLLDVSGSMAGASLASAVAAARLCLRHLRQGDLFEVMAFHTEVLRMEGPPMRRFDEFSLRQADAWLRRLEATGGTELFDPLVDAVHLAEDGIVVLLTDGQVANEAAIAQAVRSMGSRARIYGFGVGDSVCEGLLRDLARHSGGAVELIVEGESIDEKVVAQFARATAPRIDSLELLGEGVELSELVPGKLPPLVDGEPWTVLGRYRAPGSGRLLLAGHGGSQPFDLDLSFTLPARAERPELPRLWARERIRELEQLDPGQGPHHEATVARVVELAQEHDLLSRHTSLLAVETRQGERLAPGLPAARVVPVQLSPARAREARYGRAITMDFMEMERGISLGGVSHSSDVDLLQEQGASGLWGEGPPEAQLAATAHALGRLAQLGVASDHALHGAPVQKAIEAVLATVDGVRGDDALVEAALAGAWLVSRGRRGRAAVRAAIEARAAALIAVLDDEAALRARLASWARTSPV